MSARLRVSRTHYPVTALGPGKRLGIWVQGCSLSCKGCMSLDTWNPAGGVEVSVDDVLDLWREAVAAGAAGVTVSGGEPLQQPAAVRELLLGIDEIRSASPSPCDILVYTGYEEAELTDAQHRAVEPADVLVTGRFDIARPTTLIWRGSANQRMVMRTDLGRVRYAEYVDATPDHAPLQVRADGDGIWLIGTPRRGALSELERDLRRKGLGIVDVSWRP